MKNVKMDNSKSKSEKYKEKIRSYYIKNKDKILADRKKNYHKNKGFFLNTLCNDCHSKIHLVGGSY